MPAKILKGREVADQISSKLKSEVALRCKAGQRRPGLAMIQVGTDSASTVYVQNKAKACEQVGFKSVNCKLPIETSETALLNTIAKFNADSSIDGILVQLPLPEHIDASRIIEVIHPKKDVDGFHPYNIGRLAVRLPALRPATPKGIMHLLAHTKHPIKGRHAVIVGASNHVGRPMGLELLLAGCTTTTVHKFTHDTAKITAKADILISAAGKVGLIRPNWVKPGAIVIDVGLTRQADGTIKGDVEFDTVAEKASWITPVPGGVGPVTIASLLENTWLAATSPHQAGMFASLFNVTSFNQ